MRYAKTIAVSLVPALMVVIATAGLVYLALWLGSPGGPMAPAKWDGRYHAAAGETPVKTPERWRRAREEGRAEVPQMSPAARP